MKIAFLTNIISPHQLPLAYNIVNIIGEDNYRYIYTEEFHTERQNMGWESSHPTWCIHQKEAEQFLLQADILLSELRDLHLFEEWLAKGKTVIYISERWLKPPVGIFRLLHPSYFKMVFLFMKLFKKKQFLYFPQGIHAARDFIRLYCIMQGKLQYLFMTPKVAFESSPGGRIIPLALAINQKILTSQAILFAKKNGFTHFSSKNASFEEVDGIYKKIRIWGYFVAPHNPTSYSEKKKQDWNFPKKVLWLGRMVSFKKVETIIQAAKHTSHHFHLYGHGSEEKYLKRCSKDIPTITFHDFVPITEVRKIMAEHDIYVLSSNGGEGWGAVVNEALEEGCQVFASIESGAGATILPPANLFHAGHVQELVSLLKSSMPRPNLGLWRPHYAAQFLTDFLFNSKGDR